jgi:hypothetical protein
MALLCASDKRSEHARRMPKLVEYAGVVPRGEKASGGVEFSPFMAVRSFCGRQIEGSGSDEQSSRLDRVDLRPDRLDERRDAGQERGIAFPPDRCRSKEILVAPPPSPPAYAASCVERRNQS